MKPTDYWFYGIKIRGIPLRSVYEGIKITDLNRKRKIEKQIVMGKIGANAIDGFSLNQAFHIKIGGIEIPYIYTIFFQIYNVIGGIRLALRKPYDIWS